MPATRRPGWPATVVSGKPGSDAYGTRARALEPIGDAAQTRPEHDGDVGAVDAELLGGGVRRAPHAIEERRVQLHDGAPRRLPSRNAASPRCRNAPGASTCDRWPAPAIGTKRAPAIAAAICCISAAGVTWSSAPHTTSVGQAIAPSSADAVGAVAQRLDAGAQAGGARLGARRARATTSAGGACGESRRGRLPAR